MRIIADYRVVTGWREGGVLERLWPLPAPIRGRARALIEGRTLARMPRPDVIWTSVGDELLASYAWMQLGPLRRALVVDTDATRALLEPDAQMYYGRQPRTGLSRRLLTLRQRVAFASVTYFAAWSMWAADGLEREGIARDRIRIVPPGVDLGRWLFVRRPAARPVRLLFVGADFERKGGPMLLEVVRSSFGGQVELDIVTHADVKGGPGVRVHRAAPNSPMLHQLFEQAHLFVLPSRAECFGIAAIEAMASGLPVIMSDVGATREIVDDGVTGWVIRPEPADLASALQVAVAEPSRLAAMGRKAREVAEKRFDGPRNDRLVVDLLLEAHRFTDQRAS